MTLLKKEIYALKELKVMDREENNEVMQEYFYRECTVHKTLDHPVIVKYIDHFSEGGKQYIVLEYIEGKSLFQ